jgi:hypothetical protein
LHLFKIHFNIILSYTSTIGKIFIFFSDKCYYF